MAVKQISGVQNFIGLSTDTKPAAPAGSTFYEYDTGLLYVTYDGANWVQREDSRVQLMTFATTIDLAQAADDYDLAEAVDGDCLLQALVFRMPDVDASDDATLTAISIQTDDSTPYELISAATGAVANLDPEAQLVWAGTVLLAEGQKVQLTISGGAADAATVCKVVIRYSPVTAAAHLEA
jgi:hypothetical protein